MKWNREEYIELMSFGKVERQMFVEIFGPLVKLDDEWRTQGATEDEINMYGFDWDYVPTVDCGANIYVLGGPKSIVLEDNDEYKITKDELGRTMKLAKNSATVPLPLDYPVKSMDDWLKIKPMFQFNENRIDWDMVENAKLKQKKVN